MKPDRTSAPTNERGTEPGNEKWSYLSRKVWEILDVGIPVVRMSWMACIWNDSSTLVYGAIRVWKRIKKVRAKERRETRLLVS